VRRSCAQKKSPALPRTKPEKLGADVSQSPFRLRRDRLHPHKLTAAFCLELPSSADQ
jgi:hypothetical protein